jgi:hypothetical protein
MKVCIQWTRNMMNFDQQELQRVPWKVMDFMNQELVKGIHLGN